MNAKTALLPVDVLFFFIRPFVGYSLPSKDGDGGVATVCKAFALSDVLVSYCFNTGLSYIFFTFFYC